MDQQTLAMKMHGIYTLEKSLEEELEKLKNLKERPLVPLGNDRLLNASDVGNAIQEEQRTAHQNGVVNAVKKKFDLATKEFEDALPARILDMLIHHKHILTASWVDQNSYNHKYGPYAAIYRSGGMEIVPFQDINDLKAKLSW